MIKTTTAVLALLSISTAQAAILKPPSNLTVAAVSTSQINLTWADNSLRETGFEIWRATSPTAAFARIAIVGKNVRSFSNTGLTSGTSYSYKVRGYNSSQFSIYSEVRSATTAATTPSPGPTIVPSPAVTSSPTPPLDTNAPSASLTAPGNGSVLKGSFTLFASASDNVGVSRVEFYRDSGVLLGSDSLSPYDLALNSSALADGAHSFYVKAFDAAGNMGASSSISITLDNFAPSVPAGLSALPISTSQINISWAASADQGTSVATYQLYRNGIFVKNSTSPSASDSPLSASTQYCYQVVAVDQSGNASAPCAQACATTLSPTPVGGGALQWVRTYGGTELDNASRIAFDSAGNMYLAANFRLTADFGDGQPNTAYKMSYQVDNPADMIIVKYSPTGQVIWKRQMGAHGEDYLMGIAVDQNDNVIVTGVVGPDVDYGNGKIPSPGGWNTFVAKYASDGRYIWAKQWGGPEDETPYGLALDSAGDIFIVGGFWGTTDMGAGPIVSHHLSVSTSLPTDIFIVKYSGADGRHLWSKYPGGVSNDRALGVAVDSNGDALVTGYFGSTVDFGNDPKTSAGTQDIFLAKYAGSDGHILWADTFGNTSLDSGTGVAVDQNNNVFITGYFAGSVNFGGEPHTTSHPSIPDSFLAKFSPSGAHLWSLRHGGTSGDQGLGVAVDSSGNAILMARFQGSVDFGGGLFTASGKINYVFAKYSAATGSHLWSKHAYGGDPTYPGGVFTYTPGPGITSHSSGTYFCGDFHGTVDFLGQSKTSRGRTDMFILKLAH